AEGVVVPDGEGMRERVGSRAEIAARAQSKLELISGLQRRQRLLRVPRVRAPHDMSGPVANHASKHEVGNGAMHGHEQPEHDGLADSHDTEAFPGSLVQNIHGGYSSLECAG